MAADDNEKDGVITETDCLNILSIQLSQKLAFALLLALASAHAR